MSSSRYSGFGPKRDEVTVEWKKSEMGGVVTSQGCYLATDVSEQPVDPIFNYQELKVDWHSLG